ncbi:adenylate isopentenyltransferase 5, chloroplastic-like [Cynara cardunculus var. scolymus]|uniref:tRNA isopentenyltransferase n=1 Tax=Cynara cardunculus var. scolymus TaxID=59895 RepID=A0A103Y373_CYNCS|nr:adenylate isopentenyltransferase 5, chloroplastic-like [Cynara cardunculus var. scolymus]KVI01674.1 tRNA isopentenyltransferase [Cynara cardunculus var. scolymus]
MKRLLSACKEITVPSISMSFPGRINMESFLPRNRKDKVVIVMGATGTGKSRLSIDLATKFPAEIINSDKMQVYKGLDIATNKVTDDECHGIAHHLLGFVDPNVDFTADDFRHEASLVVESIVANDRIPIIVGGSNSFIKALVHNNIEFQSRYCCCFLWVHVSLPVLQSFVSKRVDRMVQSGLVDEIQRFYNPKLTNSKIGLRRAIGVPELDHFFKNENSENLKEAINKIKANTCKLASRQLQNILSLQTQMEWDLHHLDATEVFLKHGFEADEAWERLVARPSGLIVRDFLYEERDFPKIMNTNSVITPPSMTTAVNAIAAVAR